MNDDASTERDRLCRSLLAFKVRGMFDTEYKVAGKQEANGAAIFAVSFCFFSSRLLPYEVNERLHSSSMDN